MEYIEDDNNLNYIKNNYILHKNNINCLDKNRNIEDKNSYDDELIKLTLKYLDINKEFPIFKQNNIKFNDLLLLTRADLIELNVALVERNRLLNFSKNYLRCANAYSIEEINRFFNEYKILNISLTNSYYSKKKNGRLNTVENDKIIKSNFFDKKINLKISKNSDNFKNNRYRNLNSYTNKRIFNRNNIYQDNNNVLTEDKSIVYNCGINKNNNNMNLNKFLNYEEKEKNKNSLSIEKFNFDFPSKKKSDRYNYKNKLNSQHVLTIGANKTKNTNNNFLTKFNKLSFDINEYFKSMDKLNKKNKIKEMSKFEQIEKVKTKKNKKSFEKNQRIKKNISESKNDFNKKRNNITQEKNGKVILINMNKKNKYLSTDKIKTLIQLRKHKEDLKNQLMSLYDKNNEIKNIIKCMDEMDD